jgi:AcrR family transcriptional regulator
MPRIEAPTLAEHNAQRRLAVVSAAVQVLREGGPAAVTPAAVAAGAGLARSSLYQYCPSTAALLAAAVEEVFAQFAERLSQAVAHACTPASRLDAYVRASLEAAVDGHGPMTSITEVTLPADCRDRVRHLHEAVMGPLHDLLAEAGVASVPATAGLVFGVLNAAATQLDRGADLDQTCAHTQTFVRRAVGLNG